MGHSSDFDPAEAAQLALQHPQLEGALLPILHRLQERFGWIAPEAVAWVAERLNLSRAEVHGVVSFYHDFRDRPAGRQVIKLCQAEACQARGSRQVTAQLEARLGVKLGHTAPDRSLTLEPVYCLGLCGNGPAALVDGRPYADLAGRGLERCLKVVIR